MAIGSSSQGSALSVAATHIISNSVGSNHKAPLLHPSEYDQWVARMEDCLFALDEDLWRSVSEGPVIVGMAARFGATGAYLEHVTTEEKRQAGNDGRAVRKLRCGLPPTIYTRVKMCKLAFEIWRKLKDLYEGTDKRKKGQMTAIITELRKFAQKDDETLEDCYNRYSILLDNLAKHDIQKSQVELNVTFMQSLRKEWHLITTMVRVHERVDDYSLTDLYDLLKNHEKYLENVSGKSVGGPMAFLGKEDTYTMSGM